MTLSHATQFAASVLFFTISMSISPGAWSRPLTEGNYHDCASNAPAGKACQYVNRSMGLQRGKCKKDSGTNSRYMKDIWVETVPKKRDGVVKPTQVLMGFGVGTDGRSTMYCEVNK